MPSPDPPEPKLQLGRTVATQGAIAELTQPDIWKALSRHSNGDWGDVCAEDGAANDAALRDGSRVLSSYRSAKGVRFWVITEWDRSVTTVLLPSEY
ncbi:MAG TPA: hypothetical protein VGE76_09895 [Opitutaceae bacterium]